MIPSNRRPSSSGEILDEEFLKPLGITQTAVARHIRVPVRPVNEIIRGRRAISPETAQLLAAVFGTSARFWMNAQTSYDLATHRIQVKVESLVAAV